ncbi:hypothetical protein ZWY2020_040027 [Hordeum vulgare]|nr:hypothetical protein ZWY2020_040027 [Hordeum vulgare]
MSSVDAAGNPLRAFTSATSLLFRTLGPAASPSRSPGVLLGGSLVPLSHIPEPVCKTARLEEGCSTNSKTQVAIFVVLALTLRRKPDVLINLSPKIVGNSKCLGQEKLPIIAWVINQASQGGNPQSRDLVLQLLERFLSTPNASKARAMLLNGAVRKGERVVPAGTLDLFMRCTFPVPNARVKALKGLKQPTQ